MIPTHILTDLTPDSGVAILAMVGNFISEFIRSPPTPRLFVPRPHGRAQRYSPHTCEIPRRSEARCLT